MDAEKLREVLEKHKKWLNGEDGGEQADLHMADMRWEDMREADMREAEMRCSDMRCSDMREADIRWAQMHMADMRCSDMRWADIHMADIHMADMRGANLDFSCWPLWCGSFDVIVDKRIAAQLAYHFCRIICDDEEVKAVQKALAPLANQFHRVEECGRIETGDDPIDVEREDRPKRKGMQNGISDFVFATLALDGPMKTGEITRKTGLEPKQAYNAVYYLQMKGLIEKKDRKWRAR